MRYLAYSLLFLCVLNAPYNQKPKTHEEGILKYYEVYSELFLRIEYGDIHKDDAKLYLEGAITVRQTNNAEGSEFATEVMEKIIMYSPKEFIYWYDKLNKEEKKIILFCLSIFPEDTDLEKITAAVNNTKTIHRKAKREILKAIR